MLGDLDVTPIDPNLNVEFDQNANFAKIYAGLAITGNKGPDGQGDIADTDEGASGLMRMLFNLNELLRTRRFALGLATWMYILELR